MLNVSRTKPFRNLQAGIGRSTYRLNTIVVGLELVARGGERPPELSIKWESPAKPAARQVADQAKSFALVSALVYGADIFDTYLREIVEEEWLRFDPSTIQVAGKRGSGPGGHDYSMRERTLKLMDDLGLKDEDAHAALLDLLAMWRNNVVHRSRGKIREMDTKVRLNIIESSEVLRKKYANIAISKTLEAFDRNSYPSRKDTTVLLAACQNLARRIDEAAIRRVLPDELAVEELARCFLSKRWTKASSDQRGWREFCLLWALTPQERERGLIKVLGQMLFTQAKEQVSPILSQEFVVQLAHLSRRSAELRLAIA